MTIVRFVEQDGKVTDIRFQTKWAARLAARVSTCKAAFVVASDEQPSKATGKVRH